MERVYQPGLLTQTTEQDYLPQTKPALTQGIDMDRLIGVPHLFSRLFDTREGFHVVPIGVMKL